MPKLIRIYDLNLSPQAAPKETAAKPPRSWFVAFSILISFNVLLLTGLATFVVLARR